MSNPFWEQQQEFFKKWNEAMGNMIPGKENFEKMYKNMMPDVSEYWKKYAESIPNMADFWKKFADWAPNAGEYWKKMAEMIPGSENFTKMFNYQIPGMDLYTKIMDFWKEMGNPAKFMQDYQEKYMDIFQEFFKNLLPAGSAEFFAKPKELMDTCIDFYNQVAKPWMEIDPDILQRVAAGDLDAYKDFFAEFNKKYEETFDKLFNMMGMGLNREANEDQMKLINSFIKMMFSGAELAALVMDTAREGMKILVERYQAGLEEGKTITTFREFYELWYNVNEEVLLKLFNTDEFSKLFAEFADKYSKYLIAMNAVYERMLAPLPVPKKTDMDSLYKTVYDLRKKVRDLERELDAIKDSAVSK